MTPAQLADMANEVLERWPTSQLEKNHVGNLAVMLDGDYIAWLDLRTGEVNAFSEGDYGDV